jgi:FkbM family methyltransferase
MLMTLDLAREGRTFVIGTYEEYVAGSLSELCRPGMVAFDIGAHIGYFTLVLSRLVGNTGQVYAFEPNPFNIQRLREHVMLNGLQQVVIKETAVSQSTGSATLYYWPRTNANIGSIANSVGFASVNAAPERLLVATRSVDDLLEQEGITHLNVVKIDAEGEEVRILNGMTRALTTFHPIIVCEFHSADLASDGFYLLRQYGYTLYDLQKNPKVPLITDNFEPYRTTLLACFRRHME